MVSFDSIQSRYLEPPDEPDHWQECDAFHDFEAKCICEDIEDSIRDDMADAARDAAIERGERN